ncbi:hypothetical protein H8356DRAFT_1287731 [Neocallimastix lanati (nom. inval.)]|nr:hypothetical protein H8356DRAFT_1287731 [Neocallimastix sp. JGI-2020a]
MEKTIKKSYNKTQQDNSSFLVIYILFFVITAIWVTVYYKKLKAICVGYILKNIQFKNLYNNLLDDPLEIVNEENKKNKNIFTYSPFEYIQNINYRILNLANFKYSISTFLKNIQSPLLILKKIEIYLDELDYHVPKKIKNNRNKGKSLKICNNKKENVKKNGSLQQVNLQKKKKKQRQRMDLQENHILSSSTSSSKFTSIPSSPVPIFYESFIIQKATSTTTPSSRSSSSSLVTTIASVVASSSSSSTTISSKSLSSSKTLISSSNPSFASLNKKSYNSSSMVSIVSSENDKDKIKSYPKKKITEKKEEKTLTAASSSDSSSIPSSSSAVIELKSENKSECPIIDTKNSIKFSQPITPQISEAPSIHSVHSLNDDSDNEDNDSDEDTCYDSYISSEVSDNYSTTSELSDSEDDVIILINPEQDLSFLSPRIGQNNDEANSISYHKNDFKNKNNTQINNEEYNRNMQRRGNKNNYNNSKKKNEIEENRRINSNSNNRKNNSYLRNRMSKSFSVSNRKYNNTMNDKSSNTSSHSLKTLISSFDDLANQNKQLNDEQANTYGNNTDSGKDNNNTKNNTTIDLSPKPSTDILLSSFKEPYLVKSFISTTSSIQQSPSLSVSSVFSEQSDSSSATLVHPSYSQISTTSTFSTKDNLTASTTELTVKSSAILDKEQGQNCSPNINVNISINNNSSTTTSPLNNNTKTTSKSSVFYSSAPMRMRRNKHYYPSVVSHSRSYNSYSSSSIMQRHIRKGKNYSNFSQGYFIPQGYLRNSNGSNILGEKLIPVMKTDYCGNMTTNSYCPVIYNTATPYTLITTPNSQGISVLSTPMILYPTQAMATVVSSTPFNSSNYIIIDNSPNLNQQLSSSSHRYNNNKRFNFNKKRPLYFPYFKRNNNYYHYNNKNLITHKLNNKNNNNKSICLSTDKRIFKSKRFSNNQRIQKRNGFNIHKSSFHKTFKKAPLKADNEYYYQSIPVIAQQQPNAQYVFFNTYNNQKYT